MSYDLFSDFDLASHKAKYINYMEAIILPTGEIQYAVPSHTQKMLAIAGLTFRDAESLMSVADSPIEWLIARTGCVAVWSKFYMGCCTTEAQLNALRLLISEGLVCDEELQCAF